MKELSEARLTADIVVVGAGGAGLAAALTAADGGIPDVLVLEARGVPGGNSVFAEGLFAIDNKIKDPADIRDLKDKLLKRTLSYTHSSINPRLVSRLINEAENTLGWLTDKGFDFEWLENHQEGEAPLYAFDIKAKRNTGAYIMKALAAECQAKGIKIINKTRARKILTDDGGKISGLLAEAGEQKLEVSTGCIILASGGFAGNRKLLRKYFPSFTADIHICGLPNRGDGILMAAATGADISDTIGLEIEGPTFPQTRQLRGAFTGHRYTVWVNNRGERFAEETFNPFLGANSLNRQPGKICYTLMDEEIKSRIMAEETEGEPALLSKLEKLLATHTAKGRIKSAGSWDEIAQWAGVPAENLKATINEYNTYCEKGHDALFCKNPANLLPLRQPPFHAIRCRPSLLVTHGSIRINTETEVLDTSGNAIGGLFAAGVDTGGVDADTYNFHLPGHSFGFALNTGRIAGKRAAEYIKRTP